MLPTADPPRVSAHSWFETTRQLTLQLVGHSSVTGTLGEATGAAFIRDLIAKTPYFQRHPEHLRVEPVPGDALGRSNVVALVRGSGSRAVVLAGHFDVVSTANYGMLEPWACAPLALLPRLIADLRQRTGSGADARALADLESGDFLPGRGALDMKSGLAAGIAVLQRFAAGESRQGRLIFVATPDEEDRSVGMRAIAPRLPQLAAGWGLTIEAAVNLDATGDLTDGTEGQVVYFGSVGKLLVSTLVVGRDTHAGYPFDGINANYLASCITTAIDCNADLADVAEGEAAPPPSTLKQGDLKVGYDVTTPVSAWACYNVLTHRATAATVLTWACQIVEAALRAGIVRLGVQAERYAVLQGKHHTFANAEPLVITFADLKARVLESGGATAAAELAALIHRLSSDPQLDLPSFSRRLTDHLWRASGLTGPAAVVGLASLPYPSVYLEPDRPNEQRVREAVDAECHACAAELGVSLHTRGFFQGISDMSFLGRVNRDELAFVAENTPPWGSGIRWDVNGEVTPGIPTINVGPWGRDYHQRLERVHMPYSFGVLPEVVWRLAQRLLQKA